MTTTMADFKILFAVTPTREAAMLLFGEAADNLDPAEFAALVDTVAEGDFPLPVRQVAASIQSVVEELH